MKKRSLIALLLILMLTLCGCAKEDENTDDVGAVNDTPEQSEPSEPEKAVAVSSGKLLYTLSGDLMFYTIDEDSGWFIVGGIEKGYGTPYYAISPEKGVEIPGEEGAEVVLCKKSIVQFVWRYADGSQANSWDVYYYSGDDPQKVTLYAVIYDSDGKKTEEREVLTMTQSSDDPYFSKVYPKMEEIVNEFGGGNIMGGESMTMLTVSADGEDAVVADAGGNELWRLTGIDATVTYAFASETGKYLSVCRPDTQETEFYEF